MVIDKLNASKYFLMGGEKQSTPSLDFDVPSVNLNSNMVWLI